MADNKTATVMIGEKHYTLTPMTVDEHVRTKLLGVGFTELQRRGQASEEIRQNFEAAVLQIILASLKRADPDVTLEQLEEGLSHADTLKLLVKLCEISVVANVLDPLTGPIQ